MPLLETITEEKLLSELIELVSPLATIAISHTPEELTDYLYPLIFILITTVVSEKEFRQKIQTIKLNYYKRNLLILEKILEKRNTLDNTRLALQVVRENLNLSNISSYINSYHLEYTYSKKNLYRYKTKDFILQEPQEYHQLELFLDSININ